MTNYSNKSIEPSATSYTSRFVQSNSVGKSHGLRGEPAATHDEVRFVVMVDDTPFEFKITRQALEDLDRSRVSDDNLLDVFLRNQERAEALATKRIEAGARWPDLVIRMQDVH